VRLEPIDLRFLPARRSDSGSPSILPSQIVIAVRVASLIHPNLVLSTRIVRPDGIVTACSGTWTRSHGELQHHEDLLCGAFSHIVGHRCRSLARHILRPRVTSSERDGCPPPAAAAFTITTPTAITLRRQQLLLHRLPLLGRRIPAPCG
jgi:hypothetical protein